MYVCVSVCPRLVSRAADFGHFGAKWPVSVQRKARVRLGKDFRHLIFLLLFLPNHVGN